MSEYVLEMKNITKIYDNGIVANDGVDFGIKEGEIHALVGENGAGKTTLMRILFGMEQPTAGEIRLNGKPLTAFESKDAIRLGIGMVHQHFMLVDDFTVAQNVMLGIEPKKGLFADIDECERRTRKVSEDYNLPVDPKAIAGQMPVGVKQKIEILKALIRGAKILILDEPTAVLTPQETKLLFEELHHLKDMGYSIIFISHKIREIKQISSRVTVMRGGKNVGVFSTAEVSEAQISSLIMGAELNMDYDRKATNIGEVALEVSGLSLHRGQDKPVLNGINFRMRHGSILGIAGVQGNGQVELVQAIAKGIALEQGDVRFKGRSIRGMSIRQMRDAGFAYIPEDRLAQGVGISGTIEENLISSHYERDFTTRFKMLDIKKIRAFGRQAIRGFEIKCFSGKQKVGMLSGGNMQKVVAARECGGGPDVMIAEQPTRGIDVGSAYVVHKNLFDLRDRGAAILLVSADLSEVLQVCDRLIVMYGGEIVAYFENMTDIKEEELGLCMLGIERHSPEQIGRASR